MAPRDCPQVLKKVQEKHMRHKYKYSRTVCGHEFRLSNFRQTNGGFDADLYIDGEYCGACTEKGHERNWMTVQTDRELAQSKARLGYRGSSKRVNLRLIYLILSYEMTDAGINMTVAEQREKREQDRITREFSTLKRKNTLLELKNDELRHKMRSRIFRS